MEALRAAIEDGPRAVLPRRGERTVRRPGGKTGWVRCLPTISCARHSVVGFGWWTLVPADADDMRRKLLENSRRFPLDIATYRWAALLRGFKQGEAGLLCFDRSSVLFEDE